MDIKITYHKDDTSQNIVSDKSNIDVLVFAPHPDDAELFCGGTIIKLVNLNLDVVVADLSLGEMASSGDSDLRIIESQKSSAILGISRRYNLELPDTEIGLINRESQLYKVVSLIRCLKPRLIISPYGDSRHPDHWRSRELLDEAMFFSNLPKKFIELGTAHQPDARIYYMMREEFEPSFVTDISCFQVKKIEAINSYKSQVNRSDNGHKTLVSDPLSLTSISARDSFYGSAVGVNFAEPFFDLSYVKIDNPFIHYTTHGIQNSFIFKSK